MILVIVLVAVVLVAAWRRLEYVGYLKMGEQYERQQSQTRGWKGGVPRDLDPREQGRR